MALEVNDMALMRGSLANTAVKSLSCNAVMTYGGTTTVTSDVFDLRVSTATAQKFTWAKFVYTATKAGTAGVAALTITPYTGATNTCATAMTNYPVSVPGGTPTTGSLTTTAAGQVSAVYDIDLENTQVLEFLKFIVTFSTGTASDTLTGQGVLILGGARELPVTNAAHLTTL